MILINIQNYIYNIYLDIQSWYNNQCQYLDEIYGDRNWRLWLSFICFIVAGLLFALFYYYCNTNNIQHGGGEDEYITLADIQNELNAARSKVAKSTGNLHKNPPINQTIHLGNEPGSSSTNSNETVKSSWKARQAELEAARQAELEAARQAKKANASTATLVNPKRDNIMYFANEEEAKKFEAQQKEKAKEQYKVTARQLSPRPPPPTSKPGSPPPPPQASVLTTQPPSPNQQTISFANQIKISKNTIMPNQDKVGKVVNTPPPSPPPPPPPPYSPNKPAFLTNKPIVKPTLDQIKNKAKTLRKTEPNRQEHSGIVTGRVNKGANMRHEKIKTLEMRAYKTSEAMNTLGSASIASAKAKKATNATKTKIENLKKEAQSSPLIKSQLKAKIKKEKALLRDQEKVLKAAEKTEIKAQQNLEKKIARGSKALQSASKSKEAGLSLSNARKYDKQFTKLIFSKPANTTKPTGSSGSNASDKEKKATGDSNASDKEKKATGNSNATGKNKKKYIGSVRGRGNTEKKPPALPGMKALSGALGTVGSAGSTVVKAGIAGIGSVIAALMALGYSANKPIKASTTL